MTAKSKLGKRLEELTREYHKSKGELEAAEISYRQKRDELKKLGITPTPAEHCRGGKMTFEELVAQDPDFKYIIPNDKYGHGTVSDSAIFLSPASNKNNIGFKLFKDGTYEFGGISTKSASTVFTNNWHYGYGEGIVWFQEKLELAKIYQEMIKEEK